METIAEENKRESNAGCPEKSENILSRLNKGFRRSKAEQILRLLKDQEALTNKFKEYSLDDSPGDKEDGDNESDDWSLAGSDTSSVKETEIRPVKKTLRKQKSGRSKTSMGFHQDDLSDFSSESDLEDISFKVENRMSYSKLTRHQSLNIGSRLRGNVDDHSKDLKAPAGEYDAASVKSSRPKSSIASFSARGRRPQLLCELTTPVPQSPRADDIEVNKQRKRISNVKVDPLFRKTAVHGFGDASDRRDSVKSDYLHTPTPSNLTPRLSGSRKISPADVAALDKATHLTYAPGRSVQSRSVARSTSLAERGKYADRASRPSRNVISVDSRPLQAPPESLQSHGGLRRPSPLQASSGEPSQSGVRRPKSGPRNSRKYGDVSKSSGRTSLNVISERTQPVAVMKLPPLDSSLKKAVPERDLMCYGKEAMV